ncbi:MAG: bi-domain-containing oxidoreductase [Anaerolineales bacterium]|nr:bi-domain-containing oxidoreductase [Anaerolineales bacterium]
MINVKQVLIKSGSAMLADVPAPLVGPDGILVEVAYSLISSGTELAGVRHSGKSVVQRVLEKPEQIEKVMNMLRQQGIKKTVARVREKLDEGTPTGYSCSGVVIQVGSRVRDFQRGDRVACAGAGVAQHAEIVLVPHNLAVQVPSGCSLRDASSVALGSIAMQGVRRADPGLGETVAVFGLGLLGQITTMLLKANGCRVAGVDIDPRRTALALRLGADLGLTAGFDSVQEALSEFTSGFGVDSTIITAASEGNELVQQAMEVTRKKGRVVVVGAVGLGLQRSPFYEKEIDFLISTSYGPGRYDPRYENQGLDYPYAYVRWTERRNMAEYLRLIAADRVKLDDVLEKEVDLSQAAYAYQMLDSGDPRPLGVVLCYDTDADNQQKKVSTSIRLKPFKPDSRIGVALIGAGGFARGVHIPNLRQLSSLYHLRAVVSGTPTNAASAARQFGADYATTDYVTVLADDTVDMVMICTRHNLHAAMAIEAARAGKAIFLEKPMALTLEELQELVPVLREANVPFMVGFNRRFAPAVQRAKEILSKRQGPMMLFYRVNAGPLPSDHWVQTEEGGGRIRGEACHMLDLILYLTGSQGPVDLSVSKIINKDEVKTPSDNVAVVMRFENGSIATLVYTSLGTMEYPKERVEIFTGGRVLVIDDFRSLEVEGSKEKGWQSSVQNKGLLEELEAFAREIKGEEVPAFTLDELKTVTELAIRIDQGE